MSHRRSAIRDRLRRRELVVANPVAALNEAGRDDFMQDLSSLDSGPLAQPLSRRNRASSLSPPRVRPGQEEDLGVVRFQTHLTASQRPAEEREKLRGILEQSSIANRQPKGDEDTTGKELTPSEELQQWFRGVKRANWDDEESIPGLRVLEDYNSPGLGSRRASGSLYSMDPSEAMELDSLDTASVISDRTDDVQTPRTPFTPLGQWGQGGGRRRMMASERAYYTKDRENDSGRNTWQGVTPNEFICVSIGLMIVLILTYTVQYAVRMGYIKPPQPSLERRAEF